MDDHQLWNQEIPPQKMMERQKEWKEGKREASDENGDVCKRSIRRCRGTCRAGARRKSDTI